ncbi:MULTISPECIES: PAS domain-containing sensor histidine kinase [Cyanophyceae]|uniref:histidine kinase n=1 Tax=Leptolyngbya subtilissima DQ-A4 TaxID=2933933 RepID=A0ABV0K676_9CYAN|nr:PAS domain-containing sensor histidine kinase [Nodosilinea sp. FACHB-141]MBD2113811.1 PAS domain S-box protein [Nodosilinea sp. FACHB-141]
MVEYWQSLLSGPYIPHGHCYLWQPGLVWLHLLSDALIALSYWMIAGALVYFVKRRPDVPFRPLFWLFATFIAACGATHLLAVWTLWFPTYWVSGTMKALTALVSLATAMELVPRLPSALALPNATQLMDMNRALQDEIGDRKQAEASLRTAEQEVRQLNQTLEDRVQRRTAQLEEAKQQIETLLEQERQARITLQSTTTNLQETAERLNLALSAAQMGSWDWQLDTNIQVWSPQTERIMGFEPGTVSHTAEVWAERVHPEDLPRIQALVEDAIATQTEFVGQYRMHWPDDTWHWVSVYGRVVSVKDGRAQRLVGVVQDITVAKQAELDLQASERRFRAVFEQAAVGMARLDWQGHWIQVNQKFCDILGYRPEELINRSFQSITYEADRQQDEYYYQQLLTEHTPCQFEKRYLRKDGTPLWTLVTASVESDEADRPLAFIAIVEDIEDRKAAQEELLHRADEMANTNLMLAHTTAMLEQRNAELDQFAYVASHDLKAPLRAISNLADWIGEDLEGQIPAENRRQLDLLRSRVQRMEALINGLLEYSRVGRRQRSMVAVDLNLLLDNVIDSLDPPEQFRVEVPTDLPTLYSHKTALGQVFANLINNAIKHHHCAGEACPEGDRGTVRITWQDQGQWLEFAIADDGPGIAPQYHDKIFTIFQTLKARDDFESTGVGLAVVKKIVEAENGRVWLTSAVGEGTTFYFTWPFIKTPPAQVNEDPAGPNS